MALWGFSPSPSTGPSYSLNAMSLRNENIGIVVSAVVMLLGCWLADWNPSDDAAAAIMTASFVLGFATITVLFERDRRSSRR